MVCGIIARRSSRHYKSPSHDFCSQDCARPHQRTRGVLPEGGGDGAFYVQLGVVAVEGAVCTGQKPTAATLKKQWNAIKYTRYPWLREIHRDAHAQPFANLNTAFQKFFAHDAKYPTFKKKGAHDSFYIANDKVQVQGNRLRLPKVGWVRMREALRLQGKLLSATVSQTADRWYVSFAVRVDAPPRSCENQAGRVGVDLGIAHLATLSTGEHIDGPKPLKAALKQLRRCNREVARRVRFSAHWHQTKRRLGRLHARVAHIRADALHKLTTRLAHTYAEVVIEDLSVKGMMQHPTLARAISDMGLGRFARCLRTRRQRMAARSMWRVGGFRQASCATNAGCSTSPWHWRTACLCVVAVDIQPTVMSTLR